MEFKGVVIDVQDKSGTSKKGEAFNACQFVVEEQVDRYPQSAVFDIFGDRIPVPVVGEEVVVSFSMKATEWNGKYYGKNNVWKIVVQGESTPPAEQSAPPAEQSAPPAEQSTPPAEQHGSFPDAQAEPAVTEGGLPF